MRRSGSSGAARRAAAGLTALAVALAVADDGGFSAGSRVRFAAAALAAALAAAAADPARARALVRAPLLVVLLVLGAVGTVSAAWTVGAVGDAVRWGAVTAGFAGVAFAAAVLVRGRRDAERAAALIAVLAVGMAAVGLAAAADGTGPLASRAAGRWRPAGTFQYAPALALLVISALPALLAAMARARRWWAVGGAGAAGAVAACTLALAESRTQLGFAVLVCAGLLALPDRLGASRATLAAAVGILAAAGLGAYAVAGGYVPLTPPPDGTVRGAGLAVVVVLAAAGWLAARRAPRAGLVVATLLAAGATAVALKPEPRILTSGLVGRAVPAPPRPAAADLVRDRLLHGRLRIWEEAVRTFADRPLRGGGADSYLFASAPHQQANNVYYAHQLVLEFAAELGIAGLLLALALYAAIVRLLLCARGPSAALLWPAAAAFAAANLVDWPWHLAGSGAVWALAAGGLLGLDGATRQGG